MPRANIQRSWLRWKISELSRAVRNYCDQTEWDEYWARVSETVGSQNDNLRTLRELVRKSQGAMTAAQADLDAKS